MKGNNVAYIDGANLKKGVESLGWRLDYRRFRVWLSEKYKELYKYLQETGFTLVFKEVVYDGGGKPKGNCDADLVLQATKDAYENRFDAAVIVTSDGDYAGLVKFLQEKQKLLAVLSPGNEKQCSILLKRTGAKIAYVNDQRAHLAADQQKKLPTGTEPRKDLFRGD